MKKIFRYIYLFILTSILFTTTSCEDLKFGNEFLQKPPSSDVTVDTIFSSAEYARRVLWYSYQSLPYGHETTDFSTAMYISTLECMTDLCESDIYYAAVNKIYYAGLYDASYENSPRKTGNLQTKCRYNDELSNHRWKAIRNAWLVIKNIDGVPDMTTDEKQRLKAEAKTIVAIYYAHMMRHFGALPIIDRVLSPTDQMPGRATLQETIDFIVRLLDEAIATPEFPWRISDADMANWYGRITKAGAMGLKARVLLFAASPLFNSNEPYYPGEASDKKMTWFGGYDNNRWKLAADACKDFFDALDKNGYYKLVEKNDAAAIYQGYKNEYRYAFRAAYFDRGTTESLISTHRDAYTASDPKIADMERGIRWGSFNPTKELFDMFQTADGEDFDWNNPENAKHPFDNRDPRFYETIFADGDMYKGGVAGITDVNPQDKKNYPKGKDWGIEKMTPKSLITGITVRKWALDRHGEFAGHPIQWPHLRLAEMYLSYAEALNEFNGGPNELAYKYVDAVRARVGMKGLKKGLTQEQFRAAVLRERACEFAWEEVRFFDLIRWKMADKFSTPLNGIHIYKHKDTGEYLCKPFTLRGTKANRAWWKPGAFSAKWYLSAFPSNEVNKGYGIIQNPGWE